MKLVTFSDSAGLRVGVLDETVGAVVDLSVAAPALPREMTAFVSAGVSALDAARVAVGSGNGRVALSSVRLEAPFPRPAKNILCVGKNYRTHLEELKRTDLIKELPEEPTGFIKINECLTGHDCEVVRPPTVKRLDYEPELVFVIGKPAWQVRADNAFEHVAGITILNDLTCRDTQKREVASGSRFWTAKNAPGFGPLGPYIITMDEVPDPYDIWVTCSVNGEQRMRVNTADQIWKLPRIIEHFSRLLPLQPGDMFSTGAPGGVAVGKPNAEDLFLKHGDVVECAFESPAMVLRNRIVVAG